MKNGKKRTISDYLNDQTEEENKKIKKRTKICFIKWDKLVKHNIYSFLNHIHLPIDQNSDSARFIISNNNKKYNYFSMLFFKNLSIHTQYVVEMMEILQSFLLLCDIHRTTNKIQFLMIGQQSLLKKDAIEYLKFYSFKDSIKKFCHSNFLESHIIKIYQLNVHPEFNKIDESQFEPYDFLPIKIQNKTAYFSHLFYIDCNYISNREMDIINPRYKWKFCITDYEFNQLMEKWPLLIEKYKENQKQLEPLTDEQIYQGLCLSKFNIYQFPNFEMRSLTIDSDDISILKKTMNNIIEYFKWNHGSIYQINFDHRIVFEEWMKNSQLINHPLIQRLVLNFEDKEWSRYQSQKSKLASEFDLFLSIHSNFMICPHKIQILNHVSFVSLSLIELIQLHQYVEQSTIQWMKINVFVCTIKDNLPVFQQNQFISDKTKYWKYMSPDEILDHIKSWKTFLAKTEDEVEICNHTGKQLIEFVGWDWRINWTLQLCNYDMKYVYIFKRKHLS